MNKKGGIFLKILIWENRQNLHAFNFWPVEYHTGKKQLSKSQTGFAIWNIQVFFGLVQIYTFKTSWHLDITPNNVELSKSTHDDSPKLNITPVDVSVCHPVHTHVQVKVLYHTYR